MLKRLELEEGWGTFWLTLAMIVTASWTIAAAGWVPGLWMLPTIAAISACFGLLLAKSRFTSSTATVFGTVYGLFWNGLVIGRSLPDGLPWRERISQLSGRVATWVSAALTGGTSRDLLMFVIFMGTLFWALGLVATWYLFRRGQVWPAILPAGLVVLVNLIYYFETSRLQVYLAAYMLLALLLIARTNLTAHERIWRQARVSFSSDIHFDFFRAGLATAAVLLSLAWVVPSVEANAQVVNAWSRATGAWSEVRDFFNRSFSAAIGYRQGSNDFYGDSLVLGGAVHLSDSIYLEVRVPQRVSRYYWRARVFDQYSGGRWVSTDADHVAVTPDDNQLKFPEQRGRVEVRAEITSHVPALSTLYVPAQPQWVSIPATLDLSFDPQGQADVSVVRADNLLAQGVGYEVLSSVAAPNEAALRATRAQYPDWVTTRYLQLPAAITDRTWDLAAQITGGARNPYDAALAIQNYLRQNIHYNQLISAPPSGVDPVDYLLFEKSEGYCNYYASAMIVMLRSVGIPARMAVGFAEGEYVPEIEGFRVREADAHAWPEVYFPGYGWVEFEPTVSQAPIFRPASATLGLGGAGQGSDENLDDFESGANARDRDSRLPEDELGDGANGAAAKALWWATIPAESVAGGLLGLLLGIGLVAGWWALEMRGLWGLSPVALAYGRLSRAAEWVGLRLAAALTPLERAERLARALPATPVRTIADLYVAERYSADQSDRRAEAEAAWRGLRPYVLVNAARNLLARWREPDPDERWQSLQARPGRRSRS